MGGKKIYVLDIHLVSGGLMKGVTVEEFAIDSGAARTQVKWKGAGTDPLLWVRMEQIAGVVLRDEFDYVDDSDEALIGAQDGPEGVGAPAQTQTTGGETNAR